MTSQTLQGVSSEGKPGILGSILRGAIGGLLLGGAFIGGYTYRDYSAGLGIFGTDSKTSYAILEEAEMLLRQHYLYDLPANEELDRAATAGMVSALDDPYTFYVEPETAAIDSSNLAGSFGGIGISIGQNDIGQFVVAEVFRDNPAFYAGIEVDDIIIAIDGEPIDNGIDTIDDLAASIRGDVGDPVTLTIDRNGQTLDFTMERAEFLVPAAFWRILEEDPRIGYIQLTRFTGRAPEEIDTAVDELRTDGASAFILDLRDNGGGLVDSAVGVSSIFMDGGLILTEERTNRPTQRFTAQQGGSALDETLVILVNSNTASAAEIVAGAMQDRDRATIIGEQTFGKGSVQLILSMSDGSSLHVTNAEWFTPNNNPIQGQGLTPDVTVDAVEGEDSSLLAALDYLDDTLSE